MSAPDAKNRNDDTAAPIAEPWVSNSSSSAAGAITVAAVYVERTSHACSSASSGDRPRAR